MERSETGSRKAMGEIEWRPDDDLWLAAPAFGQFVDEVVETRPQDREPDVAGPADG
jgi:hypothetical protein